MRLAVRFAAFVATFILYRPLASATVVLPDADSLTTAEGSGLPAASRTNPETWPCAQADAEPSTSAKATQIVRVFIIRVNVRLTQCTKQTYIVYTIHRVGEAIKKPGGAGLTWTF